VQLLIIRHAIAVDLQEAGGDDAERPLTEEGAKKWKEAARGLASILDPPGALLTSPCSAPGRRPRSPARPGAGSTPRRRTPAGGDLDELAAVVERHRDQDLVAP
jgi:hypothetical protein